MAALPLHNDSFYHVRVNGRLVVSRCGECGLVVAGSPYEYLLFFAERLHECPVYLNYCVNL